MFEFIKNLFRRKEKKEEVVMQENKIELAALTPERTEETEVPASRYTDEYAEFNQQQLSKGAERTAEMPEEMSLEEEMMADPFADVAAQDADVEIPQPEEQPEEETADLPTEEEMLADPFADVAAQDEEH